MNEDALFPLIDDMLEQRQAGVEAINAMFGTNITVELSSIWETKQEEQELALESMENATDVEETAEETKPDELIEPETEETDATVSEESSGEEVTEDNESEEETEKDKEEDDE